jgi:hypothetical protein
MAVLIFGSPRLHSSRERSEAEQPFTAARAQAPAAFFIRMLGGFLACALINRQQRHRFRFHFSRTGDAHVPGACSQCEQI